MKALKQIVIILAAALIVTGITYALGQSQTTQDALGLGGFSEFDRSSEQFGERPMGFGDRQLPEETDFDGFPQGRGEFGERGSRGGTAVLFNAASWLMFARTLIPIAIVIVVVVLLSKGIRFTQKRVRQS